MAIKFKSTRYKGIYVLQPSFYSAVSSFFNLFISEEKQKKSQTLLMKIEINQSNKIEQTSKDTVIGIANEKTFTVLITRKIKRKLQEEFRKQGRPGLFVYRTFIAGVVLAFKYAQLKNLSQIVIDEEYCGKDKMLKSMFLEMWSRFFREIPEISFDKIGRNSKVHNICYLTMKGKYKPDRIVRFEEVKRLALK